jgi:hypothetical protein
MDVVVVVVVVVVIDVVVVAVVCVDAQPPDETGQHRSAAHAELTIRRQKLWRPL